MDEIVMEEERKYPEDLQQLIPLISFLPEDEEVRMAFLQGIATKLYMM